jgi:hypothetical protein
LEPDTNYVVRLAPEGTLVHTGTGLQLMEEGFQVNISDSVDGMIFEIGRAGVLDR